MKLRKLILPAILALGAVGGFALAKANSSRFAATHAMTDYTGDPDIDVGIHIETTASAAADWTMSKFFIDAFDSRDVSGGDYLAVRVKVAAGAGSYFDFIPNVSGNAGRVPLTTDPYGVKFVPAGHYGEAFDFTYMQYRDWDLPLNLWDGADGYVVIPKSQFTRSLFGGAIDWSESLSAVYFFFYGTTIDKIDFDIGDIYTANIGANNRLIKVNRLWSWSKHSGTSAIVNVENMEKLKITRNNENLVGGVDFVRAIEDVDVCADADAAYVANIDAYNDLNAASEDYLYDVDLYDFADGDTAHAGGRETKYSAAEKWAAICEASGHVPSNVVLYKEDKKAWIIVATISTLSIVSLGGLFFILRRRRALNK